MKKIYLILLTLSIETIFLWGVSILLGWSFINTIFLGGITFLGIAWFYTFFITPRTMNYDTSKKDWIKQDTDIMKSFQFLVSPITLGLLLFGIVSFLINIFVYTARFY